MLASSGGLTWQALTLRLHTPFRVSYGASTTRRAFWLRLAGDAGWGEGTIPPYYGVDEDAMIAFWQVMATRGDPLPDDPAAIAAWVGDQGPAPARAAVDLALHDRIGRQRGLPLWRLLDLTQPAVLPTAFTLSLAEPAEMAEMARAAASYPVLKLKLGTEDDAACVAAVRAARPDARLRVDANAAWPAGEAVRRVHALERYDLELIEQPVAREDIAGMGQVQARTRIPVVADESVQSLADVERLAAAGVAGVNLKLMKTGGLAPCLAMLRRARALGLRVMLGCMVETSLGATAMAHLAGLADWLDLDAPLLVANDPFRGIWFDQEARVHLPEGVGIGVTVRD
jgi:L-alanine-DL-glutamate epimerase-like enolase superfamily enzyme